MKINEKVFLDIQPEKLWDVVVDIPVLAKCIPGVQEFTPEGDNVYVGTIQMKVGPLHVNFNGKITVLSVDESNYTLKLQAEATDAHIGSRVKMEEILSVKEEEEGSDFMIEANVNMHGKVAQLGFGLIRPKVKSTLRDFAKNLKDYMDKSNEQAG